MILDVHVKAKQYTKHYMQLNGYFKAPSLVIEMTRRGELKNVVLL